MAGSSISAKSSMSTVTWPARADRRRRAGIRTCTGRTRANLTQTVGLDVPTSSAAWQDVASQPIATYLVLASTTGVEQFLTRSGVDRADAAWRGFRAGRHTRLRSLRPRARGP